MNNKRKEVAKRDKVIHFFSKNLKRKLTRKELTNLKELTSILHISRKKLTPFITGYLMAIRPDDLWLRKTVKGTFKKQTTKVSSTKPSVSTKPGKTPIANAENVQANHKTGVQEETRTQPFPEERASVAVTPKEPPRRVRSISQAIDALEGYLDKDHVNLTGEAFRLFHGLYKRAPRELIQFLNDYFPTKAVSITVKPADPHQQPHVFGLSVNMFMTYTIFV
jgi:hypothetical protein